MFGDPALVDRRQRGDGACRTGEVAYAVCTQQQRHITAASAFVEVDELSLEIGELRGALSFEIRQPRRCHGQRLFRVGSIRFGLHGFLRAQVPLDLELAHVAEQTLGLTGQVLAFPLQGTDPLVDAARVSTRRRLCGSGKDEQGGKNQASGSAS